jgi:hypothetical protein
MSGYGNCDIKLSLNESQWEKYSGDDYYTSTPGGIIDLIEQIGYEKECVMVSRFQIFDKDKKKYYEISEIETFNTSKKNKELNKTYYRYGYVNDPNRVVFNLMNEEEIKEFGKEWEYNGDNRYFGIDVYSIENFDLELELKTDYLGGTITQEEEKDTELRISQDDLEVKRDLEDKRWEWYYRDKLFTGISFEVVCPVYYNYGTKKTTPKERIIERTYVNGLKNGIGKVLVNGILEEERKYNDDKIIEIVKNSIVQIPKEKLTKKNDVMFYNNTPFSGIVFDEGNSDSIIDEITYKDGKKNGLWLTYMSSVLNLERNYKNGEKHGTEKTFQVSIIIGKGGQLVEEKKYQNGRIEGKIKLYYYVDDKVEVEELNTTQYKKHEERLTEVFKTFLQEKLNEEKEESDT